MTLWLAAAAAAADRVTLPEGQGRETVETVCASCHGLDIVTDKKWGRKDWQSAVNAMIDRGASLSPLQSAAVVAYLARNFGSTDRGRELVFDVCTSCHTLARLRVQALNREQWTQLIKGMISEGNPVTDEEFSLIVDYLTKNFGPRKEQ